MSLPNFIFDFEVGLRHSEEEKTSGCWYGWNMGPLGPQTTRLSSCNDVTITSSLLTCVQVVQDVVQRAEPHEHADSVHLWLHDDCQQRKNFVMVENPAEERREEYQRQSLRKKKGNKGANGEERVPAARKVGRECQERERESYKVPSSVCSDLDPNMGMGLHMGGTLPRHNAHRYTVL